MVFAQKFSVPMPVGSSEEVSGNGAPVYYLKFSLWRFGFYLFGVEEFFELRFKGGRFCGRLVVEGQVERLRAVKRRGFSLGVRQVLCEDHKPFRLFKNYLGNVEELVCALRGFHYVGQFIERGVLRIEQYLH